MLSLMLIDTDSYGNVMTANTNQVEVIKRVLETNQSVRQDFTAIIAEYAKDPKTRRAILNALLANTGYVHSDDLPDDKKVVLEEKYILLDGTNRVRVTTLTALLVQLRNPWTMRRFVSGETPIVQVLALKTFPPSLKRIYNKAKKDHAEIQKKKNAINKKRSDTRKAKKLADARQLLKKEGEL